MNTRARPLIYVAAPLFNAAERAFNGRLKELLLPHVDVFLPQADGGLVTELIANGAPAHEAASVVFAMDIAAIRRCDALLIVMDGRSIDEGASVELGVAYALGKPCIGLQTDTRRLIGSRNNPMIDCALIASFASEHAAVGWIASRFGVSNGACSTVPIATTQSRVNSGS